MTALTELEAIAIASCCVALAFTAPEIKAKRKPNDETFRLASKPRPVARVYRALEQRKLIKFNNGWRPTLDGARALDEYIATNKEHSK